MVTKVNVVVKSKIKKNKGTGTMGNTEWTDLRLRELPYLDLTMFRELTNAHKMLWIKVGLESLTRRVNAYSVAALMCCAWGMTSCEDFDDCCFASLPPMITAQVSDPTEVGKGVTVQEGDGQTVTIPTTESTAEQLEWIRAGCYMCAAALRLITKDEENLMNAWATITDRYRNFYQEDISFKVELTKSCVRGVRNQLQSRTIFRNTIGVFLLAYQDLVGKNEGMCKMLFELHMAYTGMHSYSLFLFCAAKLNTPLYVLASILTHPGTITPLLMIRDILVTYEYPVDEEKKELAKYAKTWKYARIFDSSMFAALQTKNCTALASLLACIAQRLGVGTTGDATKIRQISAFIANQREYYDDKAKAIVRYCQDAAWLKKEHKSGFFRERPSTTD